jgi:hypothetical protein
LLRDSIFWFSFHRNAEQYMVKYKKSVSRNSLRFQGCAAAARLRAQTPSPKKHMTACVAPPQLRFPLGEPDNGSPWKTIAQVAAALGVSPVHVRNLIDAGDLGMVIRLDSGESEGPGADYRILIDGYRRFLHGEIMPVDYEAILLGHLCNLPRVMSSSHLSFHFNCSTDLIVRLAPHFFNAGAASRVFFRAERRQVLAFIAKRRIT